MGSSSRNCLRTVEHPRQGPAHHVAHGDIEQGDEKGKGDDKAALHMLQLRFHGGGALPGGGLLPGGQGAGGAVSGGGHRRLNGLGGGFGRVVLHGHGVGQQVHVDLRDAVHLAHRLVHVGGAGGTGHAGHIEFLLQGKHHTFIKGLRPHRAEWRVSSILRSKILMPAEFTSAEQIEEPGPPQDGTSCGERSRRNRSCRSHRISASRKTPHFHKKAPPTPRRVARFKHFAEQAMQAAWNFCLK